MKVVFIHHSCFVVEVDEKVLIFDWFAGNRVNGYRFNGELPEYEPDTPIYIFASHKHADHFDMDVLRLADKYSNIHFILSKDCKMSPNFLKKHGIDPAIREKITYVTIRARYEVEGGIHVETLRSTDAGVAFYVQTNEAGIFHAGDLNDWSFEGADDLTGWKMRREFQTEIKRLADKNIDIAFVPINGVGNNMFDPEGTITRAQFAQILANMSGEDFSDLKTDAFSDVGSEWFAPAVAWAVKKGIADTDSRTYMPDEPISREDMALMLYRYAAKVAESKLPEVNEPVQFADEENISNKAEEAVYSMQRSGIINGIAEGNKIFFAPQNEATRAQASAMIARFCAILGR